MNNKEELKVTLKIDDCVPRVFKNTKCGDYLAVWRKSDDWYLLHLHIKGITNCWYKRKEDTILRLLDDYDLEPIKRKSFTTLMQVVKYWIYQRI